MLARVGLIAYGVVHLLVGWLALQIAWGISAGTSADTSGALQTLAHQPFGQVPVFRDAGPGSDPVRLTLDMIRRELSRPGRQSEQLTCQLRSGDRTATASTAC